MFLRSLNSYFPKSFFYKGVKLRHLFQRFWRSICDYRLSAKDHRAKLKRKYPQSYREWSLIAGRTCWPADFKVTRNHVFWFSVFFLWILTLNAASEAPVSCPVNSVLLVSGRPPAVVQQQARQGLPGDGWVGRVSVCLWQLDSSSPSVTSFSPPNRETNLKVRQALTVTEEMRGCIDTLAAFTGETLRRSSAAANIIVLIDKTLILSKCLSKILTRIYNALLLS